MLAGMDEVRTRKFCEGDFDAVAALAGDVWHADLTADVRGLAGGVDVATCLRRTTFSRVAVTGEGVCGVMLARAGMPDAATDGHWRRIAEARLGALRDLDATAASRLERYIDAERLIDTQLLERAGTDGRFEYVLFALAPLSRGHGLGRRLFEECRAWMASQGAIEAHLFTDESCTWGFYDHLGLRRAAEYRPGPADHDSLSCDLLSAYYVYVDDIS